MTLIKYVDSDCDLAIHYNPPTHHYNQEIKVVIE